MFATRIPPPIYAGVTGAIIWLAPGTFPSLQTIAPPLTWLGWPLIALGVILDLAAFTVFLRHRTTINPVHPARATSVVTSGPYRFSRNPMYLGLVLVLCGLSWLRGAPAGWVLVAVFIFTISEMQIKQEERALTSKFGQAYLDYAGRVPRWLRWRP